MYVAGGTDADVLLDDALLDDAPETSEVKDDSSEPDDVGAGAGDGTGAGAGAGAGDGTGAGAGAGAADGTSDGAVDVMEETWTMADPDWDASDGGVLGAATGALAVGAFDGLRINLHVMYTTYTMASANTMRGNMAHEYTS